jgi:hypothetical protein
MGEALISGFIFLVVIINVAWNLPPSEVQRRVKPVLEPLAAITGLGQGWAMYAPEPVRRLEVLDVRVTMADGQTRVWTNTRDGNVVAPFVWSRWQKLKELAVRKPEIRPELARWVTHKLTEPSEQPVRVEMVLWSRDLLPPGQGGASEPKVETIYSESLTGRP